MNCTHTEYKIKLSDLLSVHTVSVYKSVDVTEIQTTSTQSSIHHSTRILWHMWKNSHPITNYEIRVSLSHSHSHLHSYGKWHFIHVQLSVFVNSSAFSPHLLFNCRQVLCGDKRQWIVFPIFAYQKSNKTFETTRSSSCVFPLNYEERVVVRCLYSQTHTSLSDVLNPATDKSLKLVFIALRYARNIFNDKNDEANFMLIYAYLAFCRLDLRKTEEMSFIARVSFIHTPNANLWHHGIKIQHNKDVCKVCKITEYVHPKCKIVLLPNHTHLA